MGRVGKAEKAEHVSRPAFQEVKAVHQGQGTPSLRKRTKPALILVALLTYATVNRGHKDTHHVVIGRGERKILSLLVPVTVSLMDLMAAPPLHRCYRAVNTTYVSMTEVEHDGWRLQRDIACPAYIQVYVT